MFTYKKVGGIHFVRVLRFGFNFYWTRKPVTVVKEEPGVLMTRESYPYYIRSVLMSDGSRRLIRC